MFRQIYIFFSIVAVVVFHAPAAAYMADGPEGSVSGLIWESRHTQVPEGAVVLKISELRPHEKLPFGFMATVNDGPDHLVGSTIVISVESWNSCIGLGRLTGYVVVSEKSIQAKRAPDISYYAAVDYLPHATDRSSGLRREENWFVPGEPAPKLTFELAE